MSERKQFEMSQEQLDKILDAGKPTPVMAFGDPKGGPPIPMFGTPQENANNAWRRLGADMGFKYMTVRPIPGQGNLTFTAEVMT